MTSRLKILGLGLRQMVERIFHRCRSSIDAALDMSRAKQVDWTERCWSQTLGSANWRARLDHTLMIMIMIMIVLIMIMILLVMVKLGDDDRRHVRPKWRPLLPHSLPHSCLWSLFWREHAISVLSLQTVYSHSNWRVFIKCAFRKYVKLSKHFKTIQPSPFRIQLGNFFYAHLYPIHKKYCI